MSRRAWGIDELVGGKNVDDTASLTVGLHQIFEIERRLAEKLAGALLFERQQAALDRPHAGR